MQKDTENWIGMANYDLETARHMLAAGRYLYVVFMCHLALEKLLKAHVTEVTQTVPPRSHDLIFLIRKAGLELPQTLLEFVGKINNASIPTRYPDDLQRALREYDQKVARDYLQQTEETIAWLSQHQNLQSSPTNSDKS
jgi:HEPN domain-containing protein